MSTEPTGALSAGPPRGTEPLVSIAPGRLAPPAPVTPALEALAEALGLAPAAEAGLADALFEWITPQTRRLGPLTPARFVALLGFAVHALSDRAAESDDLDRLGAGALAGELARHRDLAERRARLIEL